MAKSYTYTHLDGKETVFTLTLERTVDLERRLGAPISEKINEMDSVAVAIEFIAAAHPAEDYAARRKAALDLFDEIVDNGGTFYDFQFVIVDILTSAGFLAAQKAEAFKKIVIKQEELLSRVVENMNPAQN